MNNKSYIKYIQYLILSLILTTIGTAIGMFLPKEFLVLYFIVSIVLIVAFFFARGTAKKIIFYIFTIGEGAMLSPILSHYSSTSLLACLLITTIIVSIFAIVGLKAKDLGFLGGALFIALLTVLIYSIVSIFIPLPSISALIIGLFCLYVMYDINCFKRLVISSQDSLSDEEVLNAVMDIYLDIINIFTHIVRIFGDFDD